MTEHIDARNAPATAGPGSAPRETPVDTEDLTGRDRLAVNVLFNWGGHFVFIVAGFLLPRMIDRRLGQDILGVWDFAWSLVTYFQLAGTSVAGSVNRYVAKYRIAGDLASLNGIVSTAHAIMTAFGVLIFGLAIGVSLVLPWLFPEKLGEHMREAQWVVFFLGTSLAIEVSFGAFNGVLTGCYRWGLQNIINSGWHALSIVAMIAVLVGGGGLSTMSFVYTAGIALAFATRVVAAYRVCPGLRVRPSLIRRNMAGQVFAFGGKTFVPTVANVLLNQTTSILIVAYLSPAALALYTRPRSLVYQVELLVRKLAVPLIPTASSLQSTGDLKGIRDLVIQAGRYSFYLALPMVLTLAVFGDSIMRFWMGPNYANQVIPAILAVGYLAGMIQSPALMILMGMNAHGRAGVGQLIASLCSVGLNVCVLGYAGWGLTGAAIAVTLPLAIMNAVYVPILICSRVHLSVRRYFASVLLEPIVHMWPFAACLLAGRGIFHDRPLIGLLLGGTVGGVLLAISYWRHVLPESLRTKVLGRMGISVPEA